MIDYEVIGRIAYIRLNRPEQLNALTNAGLGRGYYQVRTTASSTFWLAAVSRAPRRLRAGPDRACASRF